MSALNLKSNILELVCRTCLKINRNRYNIFAYSYNNKLISDLIMECTPIKVVKSDGFPANICSNCLENLNIIDNFKAMVAQSDVKLHRFFERKSMKVSTKLQNRHGDEVPIKDEGSAVKHEPIEFICDQENKSDMSNNSGINKDPLDLQNEQIKQERQQGESCDDSEDERMLSGCESTDHVSESDCSKDSCQYSTCSEVSVDEFKNKINEETSKEKVKQIDTIEPQNDVSSIIEESDKSLITTKSTYKGKNTKSPRNVNEKQVELLDNADYKRIMAMGLSKKEKSNLPVFCPICNKTFRFRYFVGIHAHLHTGNLPFKCDKCNIRFPKRPMLKQHLRTHVETKDFECDECGKAFTTIYSLRLHKVMHSTDRPYKCDTCGKAFKLSTLLQKHLRIHSKKRNHICEVCGKGFIELGSLNIHKLMHQTGNQNFPCKICGKAFLYKRTLQLHLKRHSGEKRHVCDQCGKSFHYRGLLEQHILIHTGEKPFSCEICGKKFRQRACLPRHMRIHTGETPYPCKLCPSKFKYSHHLLNHMKVHDNKVVEPELEQKG